MEMPCTDFNNTVCVCDYNYFLDSVSGRCELCTVCPMGQGVYSHCEYDRDTMCEECLDNTFSDRESSLDPCLPCTICDEDTETELAKCTPSSDSVCHSKSSRRENPLFPYNLISIGDLCREGNVKPACIALRGHYLRSRCHPLVDGGAGAMLSELPASAYLGRLALLNRGDGGLCQHLAALFHTHLLKIPSLHDKNHVLVRTNVCRSRRRASSS